MTVQTTMTTPRKARPADRPAIAATMAGAFFDDPVFRWLTPDDGDRRRILPAFFELATQVFAQHDQTWCVGTDERGLVGAAIWAPAGVAPMSEADGEAFAIRCGELAGPYADRWAEIVTLLDDHHPHHAEHDYLWFLAVRPDRHGRGHGSALLRAVLDRADGNGTPAYLDATSSDNRRLYERHGFRVIGELAVAGGPPMWQMWREP
jgi:ribosomal protein S18 acetylase RimI-like enzyme